MNPIPGVCLPPCAPSFTPKQGQYLAFIYAYSPRSSAGGSRPATLLPSDASLSPPDGAHARTRRTDPAPARRRTQHPAARRPASPAGPKDPTCQNLCVEVLGRIATVAGAWTAATLAQPVVPANGSHDLIDLVRQREKAKIRA